MTEQKSEMDEKSIIELQADIELFKRRERAYIVQIHQKDKIISQLTNFKKYLSANLDEISEYTSEKTNKNLYLNPIMLEHFKLLRNSLNEIEDSNLRREEEMFYLQPNINSQKKYTKITARYMKDNAELFQYINGNYIENMRHDNDLEKYQIEQLMMKLKDQQTLSNDFQQQLDQACETKEFLKRKIKAKRIEEENEKNNKKPKN